LDNGNAIGYTYRYDQLNRLKKMRTEYISAGSSSWGNNIIGDYAEDISYDANGNIKSYLRNGTGSNPIDNLTYNYNIDNRGNLVNNKLRHVNEAAGAADTVIVLVLVIVL